MALTVLGLALQQGLELPETGINCTSVSVTYSPEVSVLTKNSLGQVVGKIVSTLSKRDITIEAEEITGGSGGLSGATFLADQASNIANDKAQFGSPAGVVMLDSVDVKQEREGLRTNSFKLSSYPLFTSVSSTTTAT